MAKIKNQRSVVSNVISFHESRAKREISQLTIKIDKRIDDALVVLAKKLQISKNRLIEDILLESGVVEEVDENYLEHK